MMRVLIGLVIVVMLAIGGVALVDGRLFGGATRPVGPVMAASSVDTFVVHPAAPASVAAAPTVSPAPADPPAGGLEAAIERLRAASAAAKPDVAPAAATPPPVTPAPQVDPLLAGPNPAPSILAPPPPPAWTAVTLQGARWRSVRDATAPQLVIDMGGGRVATVLIDPAFLTLPPEGANARVDFLKQTILENFPRGAAVFRFARDGSVSLVR